MLNIAVLVSGGGTNLQALIDAQAAGRIPNGQISCVVSSKADAFALKRAENAADSYRDPAAKIICRWQGI